MSFICERCGECFSSKQRLQTHMSRKVLCNPKSKNNGMNGLVVSVDPDRSGSIRINNSDSTSNEKHFTCEYCGKKFTLNSNCIRHQKYRCYMNRPSVSNTLIDQLYLQSLNTSTQLKTTERNRKQLKTTEKQQDMHEEVITEKKIFRCEYCGKVFKKNWIKTRHLKYHCDKKESVIKQQQETINDLQYTLNEKNKKIEKKNRKLERVYTEKDILNKVISNYNTVVEICKNSRDLQCPTLVYKNKVPELEYKRNILRIEHPEQFENNNELEYDDILSDSDSDKEYDNNGKQKERIVDNNLSTERTVVFDKDQLDFFINLGARNGITAMIKKILVDKYNIIDRGVWCIDPNRSNFIIKQNGVMIEDRNGQTFLEVVMPGIEKIFFDDLDYWMNELIKDGYIKADCFMDPLCKRQTFVREMRDKRIKRKIARDIGPSLYAERREMMSQIKKANFDNINVVFDKNSIEDIGDCFL